jgi:tyrosyl-tRNA synthetase
MATLPWTCRHCRHCLRNVSLSNTSKRLVHERFLQRKIDAKWEWTDKAVDIKKGLRKSMLTILEERGYVHQLAGYLSSILIKLYLR